MDIGSMGGASQQAYIPAASGEIDSQISALQKQLTQLQTKKREAKQNNDSETVKKLEKQIKTIRKQIQKLKARKAQMKTGEASAVSKDAVGGVDAQETLKETGLGKYVDEKV